MTQTPPAAATAKAEIEALTDVTVDGPVVVDRGSEMLAEIRWRIFGPPVLVLSAAMARLEPAALSAVIAHEYAHVSLRHLQARLWLTIATSIAVLGAVAAFIYAAGLRAPSPILTFVVVTVALIGQRLVMYAVVRRQERQADAFAVSMVGADAVRAAFDVTMSGPAIPSAFTPWMTHDSPDARRRALDRHAS